MASDRMSELFGPADGASRKKGGKATTSGGVKSGDIEMQALHDTHDSDP